MTRPNNSLFRLSRAVKDPGRQLVDEADAFSYLHLFLFRQLGKGAANVGSRVVHRACHLRTKCHMYTKNQKLFSYRKFSKKMRTVGYVFVG